MHRMHPHLAADDESDKVAVPLRHGKEVIIIIKHDVPRVMCTDEKELQSAKWHPYDWTATKEIRSL